MGFSGFHVLGIVNSAAMCVGMHVFFQTTFFLWVYDGLDFLI